MVGIAALHPSYGAYDMTHVLAFSLEGPKDSWLAIIQMRFDFAEESHKLANRCCWEVASSAFNGSSSKVTGVCMESATVNHTLR